VRFDPSTADVFVFTFKEGLLSPVAHDLKLAVTRFHIDVSDDTQSLESSFDAASLRVVSAMRDGRENPGALSERDRRTIEGNIVDDVLDAKRFPEIRFASGSIARRGERALIAGTLTMHGKSRLCTVEAALTDGTWSTSTRLYQPDWGIKPYSAMLGTLRIQPQVTVSIALKTAAPR
jgi:polyisoprenoid-binding protein YceI